MAIQVIIGNSFTKIEILKIHTNYALYFSVEFQVPTTIVGEKPFVEGGLLDETYEVEQVHFHWGSPTRKGSEHIINGNRYDLEMHILHRNTKYPSVNIARHFEDGLAVLAVLFKVVKVSLYMAKYIVFNLKKSNKHIL